MLAENLDDILLLDRAVLTKKRRLHDDIVEFADIAGPGITEHFAQSPF